MTKKNTAAVAARPTDPETEEKQRLRSLALSRKILRRSPASPAAPLPPSKAAVKLQGRDIARRGQRKSRYLFSFPGLLAPISGGRVGELSDLASKNPVLYLEFPQGRMKLFGTHVYPKNKYLTLQLTKSSKGVMLEDIFESMIVFSDAWWIGKKEDNPQELQLEFPNLSEVQNDAPYDFRGGAGGILEEPLGNNKPEKDRKEPLSPDVNSDNDLSEDSDTKPATKSTAVIELTPVRQSARTAGKKLSYAESYGDDSSPSDTEMPDVKIEKVEESSPTTSDVATPDLKIEKRISTTEKTTLSQRGSQKEQASKKGPLVQASLSALFEKAADKKPKRKAEESSEPKGPVGKRQKSDPKQSTKQVQAKGSKKKESEAGGKKNGRRTTPRKLSKVAIDDIEDISSESQPSQDDSDEDWA